MKKNWKRLTLVFALMLCVTSLIACGKGETLPAETPVPTTEPTTEPTAAPEATPAPTPTPEPGPETTAATVRYLEIGALYATLQGGDTVKLTGEEGDWYTVDLDGVTVFVEKRFVRLLTDPAAEAWTGYAKGGAVPYGDIYLREPMQTALKLNTKLNVLDTMGECLLAELPDGTRVCLAAETVSRTRISDERDDSSGGGSAAPSGGADGGDIPLANHGRRQMQIVRLATGTAAFAPQTGTIRIDGVEAYVKLLKRGDEVQAMEEQDGRTELLIDALTATVPTDALLMEGGKAHEAWAGYMQKTIKGSGDLRLRQNLAKLARNTPVTVLDVFDDVYLIETPAGLTYVAAKQVGKDKAPELESDSGSSDDSGGSSGGSGGGEWTAPVL